MARGIASESQMETPARSRQWLQAALAIIARHREASIAIVAIVLVAYIQLNNSVFLTSPLMSVVLRDTSRIGIISMGIVLVMITGEIDLSVGAVFAMAPFLMIRMNIDLGWPLFLGMPIAILLGVGVGFFNGFITVKLRVPALITTLGTYFLLTGFTVFGQNRYGPLDKLFSWDGLTGFTPFLWTLAVALILTLVLTRTVLGLHVISTGSNLLAAKEIGVRTDRIKITTFMILGGLAALAGLITSTISGSADPLSGGAVLTLYAIAAAVIGGTALTGGSGTVIGALIGAFVIACLTNGLVLLGVQATQSNFFLGAAILAAMILSVQVDAVRIRRKR
jgi:simple sugar transport system permease protein